METGNNYIENGPKWSWWELFLVILVLISLMAFVAMFRKPIRTAFISSGIAREHLQTVLVFFSTFLQALVIVVSVLVITFNRGATRRDLGLADDNLAGNIFRGLLGGIFLGALVWGIGIVFSLLAGPPPPQQVERMLTGIETGKDVLLPFIALAVLAPVSEEIYFRGMVYPVFKARFGPLKAMVLSGMFFGSLHLDIYRFIPISIGGIVLAYLYEKSKTLTTPIIAHATWNSLMLLSYFFLAQT